MANLKMGGKNNRKDEEARRVGKFRGVKVDIDGTAQGGCLCICRKGKEAGKRGADGCQHSQDKLRLVMKKQNPV